MEITELTKADFLTKVDNFEANSKEWSYLGDKPALVEFFATWCGHCQAFAPVLEEVAAEYGDRVDFYKVDIEKEQELSAAMGVESFPSLLFVPMEGQPKMEEGALTKGDLTDMIEKVLL